MLCIFLPVLYLFAISEMYAPSKMNDFREQTSLPLEVTLPCVHQKKANYMMRRPTVLSFFIVFDLGKEQSRKTTNVVRNCKNSELHNLSLDD